MTTTVAEPITGTRAALSAAEVAELRALYAATLAKDKERMAQSLATKARVNASIATLRRLPAGAWGWLKRTFHLDPLLSGSKNAWSVLAHYGGRGIGTLRRTVGITEAATLAVTTRTGQDLTKRSLGLVMRPVGWLVSKAWGLTLGMVRFFGGDKRATAFDGWVADRIVGPAMRTWQRGENFVARTLNPANPLVRIARGIASFSAIRRTAGYLLPAPMSTAVTLLSSAWLAWRDRDIVISSAEAIAAEAAEAAQDVPPVVPGDVVDDAVEAAVVASPVPMNRLEKRAAAAEARRQHSSESPAK